MTAPDSVTVGQSFEKRHRDEREPWMFADRAAEILRHEWIVEAAIDAAPEAALDVGCTIGQLTARLAVVVPKLTAMDVSATAAATTRERVSRLCGVLTGSAVNLPLASYSFDLIVAADGLYSWDLSADDRARALNELHRVLQPSGRVILTEHMRPARFKEFVDEVRRSNLTIRSITYLYDRPWYQFESWLRAVQGLDTVRWIRRNVFIARVLSWIGRARGPSASRHICVIAEKR
jgi:SAM-dependent methyltransferase